MRRILVGVCALVLALPFGARASTAITLYFHAGAAHEVLVQPMDATPPSGDEPRSAAGPLAAVTGATYVDAALPHWGAPLAGTLDDITVTFWAQDVAAPGSTFTVQLHPENGEVAAAATSGPAGAEPTQLVAQFDSLELTQALTVQIVPASSTGVVLYDAASTPSNLSFALTPPPPPPPPPGGAGEIDPDFGFAATDPDGSCATGDELCARMMALKGRSNVVIAIADTGINPYHVAFARSGMDVHPSQYVDGFPTATPALRLSHGAASYGDARELDTADVWSKVLPGKLYWVPGTNIIGAISFTNYGEFPILDDNGHGTGTASVSAGGAERPSDGKPFGSNPDALVVMVQGLGDAAIEWIQSQPWIDFMSGSYGDQLAFPIGGITGGTEYEYTRPFVLDEGRTACFSSGNGLTKTGIPPDRWSSIRPTSGPSWVVTVGAASPDNGQAHWWHNVPVDVVSYGSSWPAASSSSFDGDISFGGTSNATPVTCGVFSRALLRARIALGDTTEGIHAGAVAASGTPVAGAPMLADGILTRAELQDAVLKTAQPTPFNAVGLLADPLVYPTTEGYYTYQGYGLVNVESGARAIDVVLGATTLPARDDVDAWVATMDDVRDVFYPPE